MAKQRAAPAGGRRGGVRASSQPERAQDDALIPDDPVDLLANRELWSTADCSVDAALGVVGTRSAMLMLREAFYGTRRFQDFVHRVGITDAAAATRLRDLVDQGLLVKAPYRPERGRTRDEYRLTPKGRALLPALLALMQWGDRWLATDGGPLSLTHRSCGQPIEVQVRCAAGHVVDPRDILTTPRGAQLGNSPVSGSDRQPV